MKRLGCVFLLLFPFVDNLACTKNETAFEVALERHTGYANRLDVQ